VVVTWARGALRLVTRRGTRELEVEWRWTVQKAPTSGMLLSFGKLVSLGYRRAFARESVYDPSLQDACGSAKRMVANWVFMLVSD
jgi:hypothetical protein